MPSFVVPRRCRAPLAALLLVASPFGTAVAQAPPVLWTVDGNSSGDWLGYSVQAAGDVDRDGFADLIVGAPFDGQGSAKVVSGIDGALSQPFEPALPIPGPLADDDGRLRQPLG